MTSAGQYAGYIEVQALELFTPECSLVFVNIYHPDKYPINYDSFDEICNTQADHVIMLGDFNTKSPTWRSKDSGANGQQVEDILIDLRLTIINSGQMTYIPRTTDTESLLDLTAVSHEISHICKRRVLESAMSDYRPIIIALNMRIEVPDQSRRSWNFRKTHWTAFTSLFYDLCKNESRNGTECLEAIILNFTKSITKATK
ncbi:hypothetical protein NPIL_620571 [Nephila pilipes]|uniref:Endonuclease/exonuclease/phosphatase domain-containing protein n=1 Tax=Nephila pilipes TaxID=299642 RepID=A0A8X6MPV5_NEPPI|nr:hypothetical protein NPIL_620571 [Nephila pilipes]